ncbi:MAG TPA: SseB family protein [Hyphomonadaceae bacterium]|jgi:hypothetical protein|nr:SseB family protein [Hyphomonadaceae bacterium]
MAEDLLAKSLEKAAADPAYKPQFGQILLASTIFVIGKIEGEDPAARSHAELKLGSDVTFQSQRMPDGRLLVPFFSSLENLQAFINAQESVNYLSIPATSLFQLTKGAIMVLNPASRVSGRFEPEEIARLMATWSEHGRPN